MSEAGCRIRVDREGPNPVLAMMTTDQVGTLASSWPSAGTSSLAIEPGAMKCESGMRFSHGCNAYGYPTRLGLRRHPYIRLLHKVHKVIIRGNKGYYRRAMRMKLASPERSPEPSCQCALMPSRLALYRNVSGGGGMGSQSPTAGESSPSNWRKSRTCNPLITRPTPTQSGDNTPFITCFNYYT